MVKERIKQFCEAEGITVSAFEKSIGVSNGYVNSISRSVGIDKLNSIIEKFPLLDIEWLLTGRGEMRKNETITHGNQEPTFLPLIEKIADQAKEIGRLEAALAEAKRKKGGNACNAPTATTVNAG